MQVISQRDFKDCGVSCMEYVIRYYDGYIPIEKLREDTCTNEEGTTAYHLVETFKQYNFDSFGKKLSYKDLNNTFLPAIIHVVLQNGMNHFVVLTHVKKEEVTIMDPMLGKKVLSKNDFEHLWDGVILFAIPKGFIPRFEKERSILTVLFNLLKKEKKWVFVILLCSLIGSFLTILNSLYFKVAMTTLGMTSFKSFLLIFLLFLIALFFRLIFSYYQEYFKIHLNKNIEVTYLYAFLHHLFSLTLEKFLSYHEADILARVQNAFEIKNLFQNTFIEFILNFSLFLLVVFFAFFLNASLSLFLFLGMLGYIFLSFLLAKHSYYLLQHILKEDKNWQAHLMEMVRLFPSMKHFNNFEYCFNELEKNLSLYELNLFKEQKKALLLNFMKNSYLEVLSFVFLSLGLFLIYKEKLELLNFITFQSLYFYFVNPLKSLGDIGPKYYYLKAIVEKMTEMIHLEEEKLTYVKPILEPFSIKVSKLSFSYNRLNFVLKNVNLTIKAKEHVFLTAESGAGKSTLCKILHGEYKDYEGSILYDKQNIKDYSLSLIRSSIVYLSQQECLFAGTIKENILFGSSEEDFVKVCQICNLESMVSKRPLRYESRLEPSMVSGGERQRILLARALLKKASLYLLDECLSEVDEDQEVKIIKKIRKYLKGKTLLYISHKNHEELFERSLTW